MPGCRFLETCDFDKAPCLGCPDFIPDTGPGCSPFLPQGDNLPAQGQPSAPELASRPKILNDPSRQPPIQGIRLF